MKKQYILFDELRERYYVRYMDNPWIKYLDQASRFNSKKELLEEVMNVTRDSLDSPLEIGIFSIKTVYLI